MTKGAILFVTVLVIGCAALWADILAYSENTLYLNDSWIVQKRMMEAAVMGADEFLITRTPLARNTLDLGAWFGFQEVVLKTPLTPVEISFRAAIPDQGYVSVTYNRDGHGYAGVRLSRLDTVPSAAFVSSRDGQFLSKNSLPITLSTAGWHRIFIQLSGPGSVVQVDGMEPVHVALPPPVLGQIGFRAGRTGAWLDAIAIKTSSGQVIAKSFRNHERLGIATAVNSGILLIAGAGLAMLSSRGFRPGGKAVLLHCAAASLMGILTGTMWYAFDYFYWSTREISVLTRIINPELTTDQDRRPFRSVVERVRFTAFDTWHRALAGEALTRDGVGRRGYPMNRFLAGPVYCGAVADSPCEVRDAADLPALISGAKPGFRLLFIGSSQSIGAGAETVGETFFARMHRILSAGLAPIPLESLNASVSGANARYLLEDYRTHYIQFLPDLVVINLGNNDPEDAFGEGLTGFLQENQRAGIQTILLEEANSFESPRLDHLRRNHETMERLAAEYQVPVYPLDDFLNQPDVRDSGFIWWDSVHLTTYGQAVVARWLAPRIRRAFDRPSVAPGSPHGVAAGCAGPEHWNGAAC